MADRRRAQLDLAELLMAVENAPPVAAADVLGERLAETFGASEVSLLVADLSGRALIRLGHAGSDEDARTQGRETAERVPLPGTSHGAALASQSVVVDDGVEGARVFAPVTNRGEAIGVLELTLAEAPDEPTLADIALAAHALAYVVIANRRFTDLFEWGQRSVPLSLAAEVQHRLLPDAFTCEAGQFTLAAWLEPAGEIAGDTFDFAMERDTLHLSMTDAMGHSIDASILATVLVGGLRNARRAGVGLAEQAHRANTGLVEPGTRRLRHGAGRADRPAGRDGHDHQRRPSATAATPRRPPRDRAAASRPAVRGLPRGAVPGTALAARAG